MSESTNTAHFLDQLYETIESRKGAVPSESYTASIFDEGVGKMTRKIGEEATEVIIAALRETPQHVISESADLLYHLMILWAEQGIRPQDVMDELESRTARSGIEEKEGRE